MAKVIRLIDDFTGKELGEGEGLTVHFSLQDAYYEMDLSADSFAKLEKVLGPWLEKATEVDPPRQEVVTPSTRRVPVRQTATGSGMSKDQLQAVRDWANANGFDVAPRGRIKGEVIAAYEAAHKS
jgi:hypothetical protein